MQFEINKKYKHESGIVATVKAITERNVYLEDDEVGEHAFRVKKDSPLADREWTEVVEVADGNYVPKRDPKYPEAWTEVADGNCYRELIVCVSKMLGVSDPLVAGMVPDQADQAKALLEGLLRTVGKNLSSYRKSLQAVGNVFRDNGLMSSPSLVESAHKLVTDYRDLKSEVSAIDKALGSERHAATRADEITYLRQQVSSQRFQLERWSRAIKSLDEFEKSLSDRVPSWNPTALLAKTRSVIKTAVAEMEGGVL